MKVFQPIGDADQLRCERVLKYTSLVSTLRLRELTKRTRSAFSCFRTYCMASLFGIHSVTIWNGSTVTPKHRRIFGWSNFAHTAAAPRNSYKTLANALQRSRAKAPGHLVNPPYFNRLETRVRWAIARLPGVEFPLPYFGVFAYREWVGCQPGKSAVNCVRLLGYSPIVEGRLQVV